MSGVLSFSTYRKQFPQWRRLAVKPGTDPSSNLVAVENYWGTTDEAVIRAMSYDRDNDLGIARVITYKPFLTEPHHLVPIR